MTNTGSRPGYPLDLGPIGEGRYVTPQGYVVTTGLDGDVVLPCAEPALECSVNVSFNSGGDAGASDNNIVDYTLNTLQVANGVVRGVLLIVPIYVALHRQPAVFHSHSYSIAGYERIPQYRIDSRASDLLIGNLAGDRYLDFEFAHDRFHSKYPGCGVPCRDFLRMTRDVP